MPAPEQEALDRLTGRTDIAGSYSYHPVRKHAVTAAGGNSYGYDANGNMTSRNGATIAWTSYNLPSSLSAAGYTASFNYAPDRSRWRQVATYSGGTETTIYVAGLVEKLTTAARVHWKHRIAVPAGEVQVVRRSDGTNEVLYITTDHLGSTDTVTDASATVLARESFGAWGARRAANWQGSPSSAEWQSIASTTRRGYTGHEHLDNVLLVHMNGRVYDPAIGRFLSADPYVDGAETTQGWNRYSYVANQSTVSTDPSGYLHLQWGEGKTYAEDGGGGSYFNDRAGGGGSSLSGTTSGIGAFQLDANQPLEEVKVHAKYWRNPWPNEHEIQLDTQELLRRILGRSNIGLGQVADGGGLGGNQMFPCSAASTSPQDGADLVVTLAFTDAGPILAGAAPYINHTYVAVTDPGSGVSYAIRSGPGSGPGGPGHGSWNNTAVTGDPSDEDFPDSGSSYATQGIGYIHASFSDVRAYMDAVAAAINSPWNPYLGVTMNSNTTAGLVLKGMGFNSVTPMLPAPGFDAPLLIGPPVMCKK